eukprot:scaffold38576_cov64-Phaeocystis_antarctica.AAC.4
MSEPTRSCSAWLKVASSGADSWASSEAARGGSGAGLVGRRRSARAAAQSCTASARKSWKAPSWSQICARLACCCRWCAWLGLGSGLGSGSGLGLGLGSGLGLGLGLGARAIARSVWRPSAAPPPWPRAAAQLPPRPYRAAPVGAARGSRAPQHAAARAIPPARPPPIDRQRPWCCRRQRATRRHPLAPARLAAYR